MLTSFGKNVFGYSSGVHASIVCTSCPYQYNNCFLEGCYIIVKHLVQFFETIQSETEGSEPQKPGVAALGPGLLRIAIFVVFILMLVKSCLKL